MWPGGRRTTCRSTPPAPTVPSPSAPTPSCSTRAPRASCCTPRRAYRWIRCAAGANGDGCAWPVTSAAGGQGGPGRGVWGRCILQAPPPDGLDSPPCPVQTVAQSRLEQANGSGRGGRAADDCVVPNEKPRGAAARSSSEAGVSGRPGTAGSARRRDRQGGLRWLFNSLRTTDGGTPPAAGIQVGVWQRSWRDCNSVCMHGAAVRLKSNAVANQFYNHISSFHTHHSHRCRTTSGAWCPGK